MLLEPKKSYAIILDDITKDNTESFAVNIVTRYLVNLNQNEGITFGRSMFNNSMVLSDTEYPNAKTIVISRIDRKNQDFTLLNITENKWEILFEIIGVKSKDKENEGIKELVKFIKANLKNEKSVDIVFYYIMNLYQVAYNEKEQSFNIDKAQNAMKLFNNIYKSSASRTERMISLINFIKNPTENMLYEMLKIYSNDYKAIASNIQALAENRLPKNLVDMFAEIISSGIFTKNLLQIMSYVVLSEDYNEFTLNCLRMVK